MLFPGALVDIKILWKNRQKTMTKSVENQADVGFFCLGLLTNISLYMYNLKYAIQVMAYFARYREIFPVGARVARD